MAGFLYLAVVRDVWSRRIVARAMANHLRTELVLDALDMALGAKTAEAGRAPLRSGVSVISIAFGLRSREAGVRPSMGSVGDCYDTAMCGSFFATPACELLDPALRGAGRGTSRGVRIEGGYNPHRRHSAPRLAARRPSTSSAGWNE